MAHSALSVSRNAVLGAAVGVVVILAMSLFTVDETQTAIRFQLGEIIEANYRPGLHWKWPLINNVRKFDRPLADLGHRTGAVFDRREEECHCRFLRDVASR